MIAICVLAAVFAGLMGGSPQQQPAQSSASEATATNAPTVTATPANIVSGPRLGGTQADFGAAFGDPVAQVVSSAPPHYADPRAPGGFDLMVCYCGTMQGTDGQARAWVVKFWTADNTTLTSDQLRAAAQDFFPPDSKYQSDFTDPQLGVIHVYTSSLLAKTFPAADFTSSGPPGPDATPGMFSVSCGEPDPSHGCTILIGN